MADSITDGGWGKDGEDNPHLADPTANQAGRHDSEGSSRFAGTPGTAPKGGFEAYFSHKINSGGTLWGRKGAPAAYNDGPYKGMTHPQAMEAAKAEYAGMPDEQKQNWEGTAAGQGLRSARELAAGQVAPPSPPYTASGATPTTPPAPMSASAAIASTPPPAPASPPAAAAPGRLGAVTGDGPVAQPATPQAAPAVAAAPAPVTTSAPIVPPQMGDPNDTARFGPKLSGGGAQPVSSTENQGFADVTGQPPQFNRASGVAAPMVSSGGGAGQAPSDASGAKPPFAKPATAGGDDVDPATGKKRVQTPAMA